MATKAPAKAPAAAPAKSATKTITRKRRNSLERKCLPRCYKTLFGGANKEFFKLMLAAWKESRRKPSMRADG